MLFAQGVSVPAMLGGEEGFVVTTVMALHVAELFPHPLLAYTQRLPLTAALPKLIVTELVPWPAETVEPVGAVQV